VGWGSGLQRRGYPSAPLCGVEVSAGRSSIRPTGSRSLSTCRVLDELVKLGGYTSTRDFVFDFENGKASTTVLSSCTLTEPCSFWAATMGQPPARSRTGPKSRCGKFEVPLGACCHLRADDGQRGRNRITSRLPTLQELSRGSRINMPISDRSLTMSAFQGLAGHGRNERRLTQASCYDPSSNRTVKWYVEPRPSLLSTQIRPPIKLTSRFEMVRPSPVPPNLHVDNESACENAPKINRCLSFGIPIPVSRTLK